MLIRTTINPGVEYDVSDTEYERLLDLGLIYDGTPPVTPADPFDARIADEINDPTSMTRAALGALGTGGSAPDATTTTKGVVQLAGMLGGTADAPTVRTATTALTGAVELATTAETTAGTRADVVTTPAGVKAVADTKAALVHTHASVDLTDLTEAVQDIVGALIVAGTNTTVSYNDTAGTFTINATASGGTTDPEIVRDTIGGALVAGAGVQITVNDVGDTITVASTAVLPTRQVVAGTGLTGGGDLSADRTLAVAYGSAAGTAAQGNDPRLSDARPPTAHTHPASAISDSTTAGRALLTAADAAAQRTALGVLPAVESSLTAYNAGPKTAGTLYFITS